MFIVKADKGKMTLLSKVQTDNVYPMEMFILGDKLVLLSNKIINDMVIFNEGAAPVAKSTDEKIMIDPVFMGKQTMQVDIFDIKDKANPTVITSYTQDGSYVSSRLIESYNFV